MTNVKETIEIRAVQPLKFLMQKIFSKQHKLLFENIEKEAVQIEGFNP